MTHEACEILVYTNLCRFVSSTHNGLWNFGIIWVLIFLCFHCNTEAMPPLSLSFRILFCICSPNVLFMVERGKKWSSCSFFGWCLLRVSTGHACHVLAGFWGLTYCKLGWGPNKHSFWVPISISWIFRSCWIRAVIIILCTGHMISDEYMQKCLLHGNLSCILDWFYVVLV